jgi:hypothetical protein
VQHQQQQGGAEDGRCAAAQPQQAPPPHQTPRGVRWADSDAAAGQPAGAESVTCGEAGDRQQAGGPASVSGSAGVASTPGGGGGGVGGAGGREIVATGGRRPPLPESGSAQLDKYLLYLLKGEHPHKFLCVAGAEVHRWRAAAGPARAQAPELGGRRPGARLADSADATARRQADRCSGGPGASLLFLTRQPVLLRRRPAIAERAVAPFLFL